jgi:hypothetical protein
MQKLSTWQQKSQNHQLQPEIFQNSQKLSTWQQLAL